MPATYTAISAAEMESFMTARKFARVDRPSCYEVVYELARAPGFMVRVFSSVASGKSRDVGEDAIRAQLVFEADVTFRTGTGHIDAVLYACTRVHRTQNWKVTLDGRMREAWLSFKNVKKCPRCNILPLAEKSRRDGGKFLGCVGWRQDGSGCGGAMNIETRRTA
jgi:hypothetical protein